MPFLVAENICFVWITFLPVLVWAWHCYKKTLQWKRDRAINTLENPIYETPQLRRFQLIHQPFAPK